MQGVDMGDNSMLKLSIEKRMKYIEFCLYWNGSINRGDLVSKFAISIPQASKDIASYLEVGPDNMIYDKKLKKYLVSELFEPIYYVPDASDYLSGLVADNNVMQLKDIRVAVMPVLQRKIKPQVLRNILIAIKNHKSIVVDYYSMNNSRENNLRRKITPHAFCHDGKRWHVRAYCHVDDKFKDFILSRLDNVIGFSDTNVDIKSDEEWFSLMKLKLIPNPKLTDYQKQVILRDFESENGIISIVIRKALLFYIKINMNIDDFDETRDVNAFFLVISDIENIS